MNGKTHYAKALFRKVSQYLIWPFCNNIYFDMVYMYSFGINDIAQEVNRLHKQMILGFFDIKFIFLQQGKNQSASQ